MKYKKIHSSQAGKEILRGTDSIQGTRKPEEFYYVFTDKLGSIRIKRVEIGDQEVDYLFTSQKNRKRIGYEFEEASQLLLKLHNKLILNGYTLDRHGSNMDIKFGINNLVMDSYKINRSNIEETLQMIVEDHGKVITPQKTCGGPSLGIGYFNEDKTQKISIAIGSKGYMPNANLTTFEKIMRETTLEMCINSFRSLLYLHSRNPKFFVYGYTSLYKNNIGIQDISEYMDIINDINRCTNP